CKPVKPVFCVAQKQLQMAAACAFSAVGVPPYWCSTQNHSVFWVSNQLTKSAFIHIGMRE
ncbi:hypothetical protein, partial [Klebsiella pneumoniae]|uniref:hypothetical protein n=1 Tax=Klebsiella pneumoniae TaxID=573 RepID=UPI001952B3B2